MRLPEPRAAMLAAACREYLAAYDGSRPSAIYDLRTTDIDARLARMVNATAYLTTLCNKLTETVVHD